MGTSRSAADERTNVRVLSGCLVMLLMAGLLLGAAAVLAAGRDRNATHYPGAIVLTSHTNYRGLPFHLRWDNSYLTTDNFTDVYNWYSVTFGLGAEARAMERCILLEGPVDQLLLKRYLSILLCNTPDGQLIYVTRSTELSLRPIRP